MTDDPKQLADSVRSGRYFEASRTWYQAMYIRPIGERALFLLIALLAGFVGLVALMSLSSLLPVTTRVPITIYADARGDAVIPRLVKLRGIKGDLNQAMVRFFIKQYVVSRESYSNNGFLRSIAFVRAQSGDAAYQSYQKLMDMDNPSSPIKIMGSVGKRRITVTGINLDHQGTAGSAVVQFTDEVSNGETVKNSRWTAKLEYQYTEMVAQASANRKSPQEPLEIKDPTFQVVSYGVEKSN